MSFGISACGHQNKDPLLILTSSINLQPRRQVLSTSHSSPFQQPRVGHPSQVKGSLLYGPPPTKEGHATCGPCAVFDLLKNPGYFFAFLVWPVFVIKCLSSQRVAYSKYILGEVEKLDSKMKKHC